MPSDHETLEMPCADENMEVRVFQRDGMVEDGEPDYVCTRCGWRQTSPAGGAAELCLNARWHDMEGYTRYAEIARSGGCDVPDEPTHKEMP